MSSDQPVDSTPNTTSVGSSAKKKRVYGLTRHTSRFVTVDEYTKYFSQVSQNNIILEDLEEYQDAELREYVEKLILFMKDSTSVSLALDGQSVPIPNSAIRQKLHSLAEKLDLDHESIGTGQDRYLYLSKRVPLLVGEAYELKEYYYFEGYLGLKGAMVDRVAAAYESYLDDSVLQKRKNRDGNHHHITLASAKSVSEFASQNDPTVLLERLGELRDDWVPVGIGKVEDENGLAALYVIVSWPSASLFLSSLDMPTQHFHISLGFQQNDIHNLPKDETTLVIDLPSLKHIVALPPTPAKKENPKKTQKSKKSAAAPSQSAESQTNVNPGEPAVSASTS